MNVVMALLLCLCLALSGCSFEMKVESRDTEATESVDVAGNSWS